MSGTGFSGDGSDGDTAAFAPPSVVAGGAPTETLVASSVGDRCVNCGSTLSSDQRYCVVCGERRGAPRFSLPVAAAPPPAAPPPSPPRAGGSRFGPGATMVAGVGTLLLALLVGFVIGNAASRNNTKTVTTGGTGVKVINVGGSSAGPSATAGSSTAASSGATKASAKHAHRAKAKPSAKARAAAKKNAAAQTNAAKKVLGGNNTPPSNTKVGQKCSGSGCNKAGYNKKTHKFDGSFFGQ